MPGSHRLLLHVRICVIFRFSLDTSGENSTLSSPEVLLNLSNNLDVRVPRRPLLERNSQGVMKTTIVKNRLIAEKSFNILSIAQKNAKTTNNQKQHINTGEIPSQVWVIEMGVWILLMYFYIEREFQSDLGRWMKTVAHNLRGLSLGCQLQELCRIGCSI